MKIRMTRRQFLKTFAQVLATYAVLGVGLAQYGKHIEAERLTTEHVQIPLKNLNRGLEGLKIVQMSDFHLYPYTQLEFIQEAISLANSLRPDLILLTGDYVTGKAEPIFELAPALAQLSARFGVVASLGNHELWTDPVLIRAELEKAGMTVLVNEGLELRVDGGTVYLAGVDDLWSGKPDLNAALEGAPPDVPIMLLAHEPDYADVSAQNGRVGLQLSGHSHGGQICLPPLGSLPVTPYARKYRKGLYNVDGMWVYTNRGIGASPLPHRINCPPEVTEITLVRA